MSQLARFTTGQHDPHCSGCPACRADCAAMLTETPMRTHRRLTAENALRTAEGAVLRVGIRPYNPSKEIPVTIPDAYAPGLAALRAACPHVARQLAAHADDDALLAQMATFRQQVLDTAATSQAAARLPATSPAHLQPPDPYARAVERLKKGQS